MAQRIIYTDHEGALACVSLSADTFSLEQIAQRDVPNGTSYYLVDSAELPADRTFRAAWELDASQPDAVAVSINMPKAREIGHVMRRAQRQAQLAPLDAEINYSVADSAKVAEIEAQRQTIRDANAAMQTAIDAADTPEAITATLAANGGKPACA